MFHSRFLLGGLIACLLGVSFAFAHAAVPAQIPSFANVTVHDPSVIRSGSQLYVFGSFLASASTPDLMHWTQLSTDAVEGNPLFPTPSATFAADFAWVGNNPNFWAPAVIRLNDGRYYFYYCIARIDQPRAVLGVAVSESVTGPYLDLGTIVQSGMWGLPSPDGTIYDPTRHPNAVDPSLFFDKMGKLWMVYGSYSGGIFILQMDPATGFPLPNQGYGKKLMGGNHSRIEGPCILYSPESDYYYLFVTYGGLDAAGGYNVRVSRSRQPDGPFYDADGNDMTSVAGPVGSFFDDAAIAPFGVKLMGNYQFLPVSGEPRTTTRGYVSPGGCSTCFNPQTRQYFLVFHTRFVGRGEEHEVRVHSMYMNSDGWLVVAPQRYAGETLQRFDRGDIPGSYKLVNHGKDITATVKTSSLITLLPDGTITGALAGTWSAGRNNGLKLTLAGESYQGVFSTQWDDDQGAWVHAFSVLSNHGVSLWGSGAVISPRPVRTFVLPDRLALYGETTTFAVPEPHEIPKSIYSYAVVSGPAGLSVDRATGVLSWTPSLAQVDITYPVTILALNTSPENPQQTRYTFTLTARSANLVKRLDLKFSSALSGGIQDVSGLFTGFSSRLPGTGSALPTFDPNLKLNTAAASLELSTTQSDFNGQVNLAAASMPGVKLSDFGFTGGEDFAVTATYRPITTLELIDQVGLYVGANSNLVTRADTIVFGSTERHSTHTQNGADYDGHFFGFGLDTTQGLNFSITRAGGAWHYYINDLEWNPLSAPSFLDGRTDLVAGVFAITPINANRKTVELASYSLVVATGVPQLTPLEVWRIRNFGTLDAKGEAADQADPDHDRFTNAAEFKAGTDPLDDTSHPPSPSGH